MDSTKWWKRLRCDCFTEGIVVQDDHQQYSEMLIPNKNDISNVTESTAGESAWDEDDIIVNDAQTNRPLPQQEESLFFDMLAPVTSKGVMELVDMAKAKFMSSSEINYPSSLTGSSFVTGGNTANNERRVELSWAKVAAKLRNKRQAQSRRHAAPPAAPPATTDNNNDQHPTGPFLLGIAFPHPAYMNSQRTFGGGKEEGMTPQPPTTTVITTPNKARYFKTSSNIHHPHEEMISKETKVVRL
ncbi:unnamed protein product [Cylindrotheca closterium]|uniref:Uncharacterized protein n=1 Tax=Cylindrotheca closterium TaxID=2856 RepID=A0AAD2JGS2_9STRA|nr:unnamed protein product [Cylindrotheca closterium]